MSAELFLLSMLNFGTANNIQVKDIVKKKKTHMNEIENAGEIRVNSILTVVLWMQIYIYIYIFISDR